MELITIVSWVLALGLSFFLGKSGIDKVLGTGDSIGNFSYMKLEKYRVLVGLGEIAGVILLLIPMTSVYGVLIIVSLMSGAAALHLSLMGGNKTWLPVLVGALSIIYFMITR